MSAGHIEKRTGKRRDGEAFKIQEVLSLRFPNSEAEWKQEKTVCHQILSLKITPKIIIEYTINKIQNYL